MSLSYEPLWQMLNSMNISKMEFAKMIGMSNATLAKLSKNEPITLTTVDKICNQFNCSIENVVKHIQDSNATESLFPIGTIVLINDLVTFKSDNTQSNDTESDNLRLRKRPYVILKVINIEKDNSENNLYEVAPIFRNSMIRNNDSQNFYLENIDIDGKPISGYISLKNTRKISSGKFEKKIGIIPIEYIQSIIK